MISNSIHSHSNYMNICNSYYNVMGHLVFIASLTMQLFIGDAPVLL